MYKLLSLAAAVALSSSGAAYAQIDLTTKGNKNVTKVDAEVLDTTKVSVKDNPAQTKLKVQEPVKVQGKLKTPK